MHAATATLLKSLTHGKREIEGKKSGGADPVGNLARVYEVARNALEYRADHLVRRAAIERILRRQLVFGQDMGRVSSSLMQELVWARYVGDSELRSINVAEIKIILDRYAQFINTIKVDRDWLVGLVSAEIEEKINPNSDYQRFTNFAFHAIKKRIPYALSPNVDLVLFVSVDRMFTQSDDAQVAYHLYKLILGQLKNDQPVDEVKVLEETWRYYSSALKDEMHNAMSVYVRRQMGPIVLVRDMYFSDPDKFTSIIEFEKLFKDEARLVLRDQLSLMRGKLGRATMRSLMYVFLTKMLLVLLVEIPIEAMFKGRANYMTLGVNLLFPVVVMWFLTAIIKLPDGKEQEKMVTRAWEVVYDMDAAPVDGEVILPPTSGTKSRSVVYYLFYSLLFWIIFSAISLGLINIGYSWISVIIFIFFLSVVSFFAYRIKQTAQAYTYKPKVEPKSSLLDVLMLPIVVVGGWLSRGVSRLNFLVFIFDFVLEAPFKIILRFLDSWFQFLSLKKDEIVG